MACLESDCYRQTRAALMADPIIQQMGQEVVEGLDAGHVTLDELRWPDGSPRSGFMMGALDQYRIRGGKVPTHIGGPAEAILALVAH